MKLFLDTADISQIREAVSWGIVDGVTTNPSHISKTGRSFEDVSREILELVDGPVSLETVSLTCAEIVIEGKRLAALHPNVVVKVPLIKEGLKAVKHLSGRRRQNQCHGDLFTATSSAGSQVWSYLYQSVRRTS